MKDDTKQELKESIDSLLNPTSDDDNVVSQNTLPSFKPKIAPIDYVDVTTKSANKARGVVNNLLKFYLSSDVINKNEYIQAKANLEAVTLGNLINQVKIADRAIQTLMSTIDSGETSPRMFEVLAGMQKTMLDIMKHQTLQVLATEESIKKIKRDIDIYADERDKTPKKFEISGGPTQVRGTRNLMKDIQEELGNKVDEDDE